MTTIKFTQILMKKEESNKWSPYKYGIKEIFTTEEDWREQSFEGVFKEALDFYSESQDAIEALQSVYLTLQRMYGEKNL